MKAGRSAPRSVAAQQRVNRPGRSRGVQKRLQREHAPVCRPSALARVVRESRERRRWTTRGCPRARGHLISTPIMAFRHRPNGAREGFSSRHAPATRRLRADAPCSPPAHRHAHLRQLRGEVLPGSPTAPRAHTTACSAARTSHVCSDPTRTSTGSARAFAARAARRASACSTSTSAVCESNAPRENSSNAMRQKLRSRKRHAKTCPVASRSRVHEFAQERGVRPRPPARFAPPERTLRVR